MQHKTLGRMGGFASGPNGYCRCPKCGYREPHQTGYPCFVRYCPYCYVQLVREGVY